MEITKKINSAIFREYDVRGIYGEDLNEDVLIQLVRLLEVMYLDLDKIRLL